MSLAPQRFLINTRSERDYERGSELDYAGIKEANETAQALIDAAAVFLAEQPRHKLGSLGFDMEFLVAVYATSLDRTMPLRNILVSDALGYHSNTMWSKIGKPTNSFKAAEMRSRVYAEVALWKGYNPTGDGIDEDIRLWMDALRLVLELPAAIPYLEAGILDTEVIKIAVESGIDVDTIIAANSAQGLMLASA